MFKVKIILQLNTTPKLKSFKFSRMRPILKCLIFNVVKKKGDTILPIPGEAQAKAMPGWLYIHTK